MSNHLRLTLQRDTDGTGELRASVSAHAFAGEGSAWFNFSEIEAFGALLGTTFPLQAGQTYEIKGGYWSNEQRGVIEQTHLALRFYPIGSISLVGCRVQLATPRYQGDRAEVVNSVAVELQTSYEELRAFGLAVSALARNEVNEVVLHAGA